jgi:hypothetical protein
MELPTQGYKDARPGASTANGRGNLVVIATVLDPSTTEAILGK